MLGGVVAEDATSFRVEQADVRVAARAGETAERLAHERRAVAVQVRELLDRVLEREAGVRPVHALAGRERDLVLRARVLGVVRDHVDPDGSQLVEQRLEERHVRVPYGVEDVHALEEASLRLPVQEVELRLEAEERLIARCAAALERPAVDAAWHRLERLAVAERVADEAAGRYLRPRHDRPGGRVGNDPHVRVARLLRVERAAHDVRGGVENSSAAVHVQAVHGEIGGVLDRDHLRAARPVHVGALEAHPADAVCLPALEDLDRRLRHVGPPSCARGARERSVEEEREAA